MSIRILLVDDHPVVRAGLRALLDAESDLAVVGEAEGGARAITLSQRLRPDVVVSDLLLPDVDGVVVTQAIRAELPSTQVIILTTAGEADGSIVRAMRAGAIGYVSKTAEVADLIQAIRAAAQGQVHLSPRAAARLIEEMRSPRKQVPLTEREREVLREVAIGRTNKQIAQLLSVAETTVKSHVSAIIEKLGVESRTQAALHALQFEIFSLSELQAARYAHRLHVERPTTIAR